MFDILFIAFEPVSLGLTLGAAGAVSAVSAGLGAAAASQQNKAARRAAEANQAEAAASVESARAATELQIQQLRQQTSLEREKAANDIDQMRGRLRVVQADSGLAIGGSALALERQLSIDAALNDSILLRNQQMNTERLRQGLDAQTTQTERRLASIFASLEGQQTSPFLAALAGGIQGAGTGLSIVGGLGNLVK